MEVAGIPILVFVSFILIIGSFIIFLIGFGAPYWYLVEVGSAKTYGGLWRECSSVSSVTTCVNYSDQTLESWFEATQAMECLGFICLLAAIVVIILKLFILKEMDILKWVTVGCLAAAAFFILVGVCVYGGEASDTIKENLHFALAFVIIAALVAIVASVLICVGMKK